MRKTYLSGAKKRNEDLRKKGRKIKQLRGRGRGISCISYICAGSEKRQGFGAGPTKGMENPGQKPKFV